MPGEGIDGLVVVVVAVEDGEVEFGHRDQSTTQQAPLTTLCSTTLPHSPIG
jgi:hypothetical protein